MSLVSLTGKQRRQLRAWAHHLVPLVQIGHKGLTEEVVQAVSQALDDHELVKVKVLEGAPISRKEVGPALASRLQACHDVGVTGRIVILYRRHPDSPQVPLSL
jgi:RNA-binding protein